MNVNEAELLGAHVGDGTLYKTTRGIVWELRGDLREREYYEHHIAPLLKSIFHQEFSVKFRSGGANGCLGVQVSKKNVTGWFVDHGFNPGRKSHTVRIPKNVMLGNLDIQFAFIRGLFDTDGCLRFDKLGKRKCYPKLEICSMSHLLISDLSSLLNSLRIQHYTWKSNGAKALCISGEKRLYFWMKHIRPGNPKHSNKYLKWVSELANGSVPV